MLHLDQDTDNIYEISVPCPLRQAFNYIGPPDLKVGSRVLVPFGSRKLIGVCLGQSSPTGSKQKKFNLKSIETVIDKDPIFSPQMLRLAHWMSEYYWHPLGEVFKTMLPASSRNSSSLQYALTKKAENLISQGDPGAGALLKALFQSKSILSAAQIQNRLRKNHAFDSEWQDFDLAYLIKEKFILKSRKKNIGAREIETKSSKNAEGMHYDTAVDSANRKELTPQQEQVLLKVLSSRETNNFMPFLLHGITGAGKTEVYLQLIEKICLAQIDVTQALVLVPEISLTPQMTEVFERRFPGAIAVVHSNMSDSQRWQELYRIRAGQAKILIGPRSAVFAPFLNLKLIIVDEEHDSSYKQNSGLCYHGRDVAIMRGKIESAAVVLGSATPAIESYQNAQIGKYIYLELPDRISKHKPPLIECLSFPKRNKNLTLIKSKSYSIEQIDLSPQEIIHPEILSALKQTLDKGEQAMVLLNRRGYAAYLFCVETRQAVACKNCHISLTLHKQSQVLQCHYCGLHLSVQQVLANNPTRTYVAFGYGSQKAEDFLKVHLPNARIKRIDSDLTSQKNYLSEQLADFRQGKTDILVGTQILAKGHDFPNVTLIAILEVDQLLDMPDFRAGEKTFQLLVQAAGRAGRGELPGRVMLQTYRPDHYVIKEALDQHFHSFAKKELEFRQRFAYPPFSKQALFEFSHPNEQKLLAICKNLQIWKNSLLHSNPDHDLSVHGPSQAPLHFIRKKYRHLMLAVSKDRNTLHTFVYSFLQHFESLKCGINLRVDIDPQDLM
ncbi:MAG: primosomal protein N' [Oligoflexales bacterium]|nr:primosomal protein N' [Oligoflexales bacterium]